MTFLVTDDSPATRRMIISDIEEKRSPLKDIFFEASDGVEALQVVKREEIDLIILDWTMPRLDGLSFVDTIRNDPDFKDKIIIMVTSEGHQNKVMEAVKAGVDAYVLKPFTPDDLWKKISPFCSES